MIDLTQINATIADRKNVFYWQTDRAVEPEQAGEIWADRHRYFTDEEIIHAVNSELAQKENSSDQLISLSPLDLTAQTNLGNVNSVRVGLLQSGKSIIIRCHPKGVANGYFHVEGRAAQTAKDAGLPSFSTLAVHEFENQDDFSFHAIELLDGTAITKWLEQNPADEKQLLAEIGKTMARLHQIEVQGFGPFDNNAAKNGTLMGLHATFASSLQAGLAFNLQVLVSENIFSDIQASQITELFSENNTLLQNNKAVLVHNDFADWNLLTDGKTVTGILDWDECVASNPISDIACWSTFFEPERLDQFLDGYWQIADKPDNFQDMFELLRLRYVISKMTLRIRRYSWDPSKSILERIVNGKKHLQKSTEYFEL